MKLNKSMKAYEWLNPGYDLSNVVSLNEFQKDGKVIKQLRILAGCEYLEHGDDWIRALHWAEEDVE